MDIALVAHVKNQPVPLRIIDPVKGHRQFDGPQVGGQVPPRAGHALHQEIPKLPAQPYQGPAVQRFQILRRRNMF